MEFFLDPLTIIIVLAFLLASVTSTAILYLKNNKLNDEVVQLQNLVDFDYRRNEVKKLKLNLKQKRINVEKDLTNEIANLKLEHAKSILELKEEFLNKQSQDYKKAFEEGKSSVDFELRITPLKNVIDNKGFFSNKKVIEIGYSHRLYINGIPCLEPNDIVVDKFSSKEINEKNINQALENISKIIDKIPDSRVKILGSFVDLGKSVKKDAKKAS